MGCEASGVASLPKSTANQGFGCMGFSAFYTSAQTCTEEQAKQVFKLAYDSGVTLFNSATFYGPLHEEGFGANLRLLRKCIEQPGIDRKRIQLMVKIAMDTRAPMDKPGTQWKLRADAEYIREDVEFALKTLGVDYIDIIVLCRAPRDVSIESAVEGMAQRVKEGKAKYIGLSEASAEYIRRAHAVHPVYCIE